MKIRLFQLGASDYKGKYTHFVFSKHRERGSVTRFRVLLLYQKTPRNPLIHIFFQCRVRFQECVGMTYVYFHFSPLL